MGLTVIGVFTNSSAAMQAIEQLIHQGILPTNIEQVFQSGTPIREDVLVTDQPTTENSLPPEPLVDETESVGGPVSGLFRPLAGSDDDTDPLSQIADDSSVVTVHAHTDDEAKQAVRVLTHNGAVAVNKRVGTYNLANMPPDTTTLNASLPD